MEENASFNAPPPVPPESAPPPPLSPPPVPPPPSFTPPPVIAPPASTPPPKRGRGWMVFALILLVLLGFSFLLNLGTLASNVMHGRPATYSARTSGPKLDEMVREDNGASDKIAVIDVDGVITSQAADQSGYNMVDIIRAQLARAQKDAEVKAVILKVNSPGGEVLASDEINRAIVEFEDQTTKPVVASMGSLAASGGYYVSAPCRWIVANELTLTGSIGVIMSTWNYRGLMDKVGLVPMTFKSGKFKDMLSGTREPDQISPEERQMVQALIDETYGRFKRVVQSGRDRADRANRQNKGKETDKGRTLADNWEDFADGRVLSGTEAHKLGFVDELGNFQDAVRRTKTLARLTSVNLIEYHQRYDFADLFRLFGQTESKAVKVDLGLDAPKLRVGQLYFLAPNFVH